MCPATMGGRPRRTSPPTLVWRKSTHSAADSCVEVADLGDTIAVRDSKNPEGPRLYFTRAEIATWVNGAKDEEFDDLT
jgi:hypothetical protein